MKKDRLLVDENFEAEYQKQVSLDKRDFKQIGNLRHNYEQMTNQMSTERACEFMQLNQLIVDTIWNNDVYKREESVRKILENK